MSQRAPAGARDTRVFAYDLILEPEEAARGTVIEVPIELAFQCYWCFAAAFWSELCPVCGGAGWERRRVKVPISIPGGIRPGTRLEVRLDGLGLPGHTILLDCRIRPR